MTGNVANPSAYSFYADAGIDWMRVGIGGGSRCTSSANVSIHYGMATLLDQINEERKAYAHSHNGNAPTKIIADGGIGWFDDIQKALALGADAVMAGKIFAECEEACEEIYWAESLEDAKRKELRYYNCDELPEGKWFRFRDYYGMSSKRAQLQISDDKTKLKTSEGIDKPVEVKYPVTKWVDNMQSYLRSCMTYTNSHTIKELRENAQVIILGGSGDAAYRK
jgi:IMP dehydrogenase/GMP reductase